MILQESVLVQLQSVNIPHYEKLGYFIPKYIDNYGRLKIKRGTKILVKISDLPFKSHVKIDCKCDNCGDIKNVVYNSFIHKENYICPKCIKQKENNPKWNFNLIDKERKQLHNIPGMTNWRKQVKKRDNHTCQKCGSKEKVQAHHINNFKHFKEQRTDINNGITLCFECHIANNNKSIHSIYGDFTNQDMLNEFLSS